MPTFSSDSASAWLQVPAVSLKVPVISFDSLERLNTLNRYEILIDLPPGQVELKDLILTDAKLILHAWTGADREYEERQINGVICKVTIRAENDQVSHWRITLVPSLWRLTQNRCSRIFQEMSPQDIISAILGEDGKIQSSFKLNGSKATEPRPYCVQYEETDFNFILRLTEEEGLFFSIEQGDQETVVFRDSLTKLPDATPLGAIPWEIGGATSSAYLEKVYGAGIEGRARPETAIVRDYSYSEPSTDLSSDGSVECGHFGTWHEYRRLGFGEQSKAEAVVKIVSEILGADSYSVHLQTSCRSLAAGTLFTIEGGDSFPGVPFDLDKKSLAVIEITANFHQGDYSGKATVRPGDLPWRPPRVTAKPCIYGLQTAFVVGDEDVNTEEGGRVKVQFHWDKEHAGAYGEPSCWVRVAQAFAGSDHGTYFVPKIGDEVVVAFEEGDPDRPLVVGSVYNSENNFPLEIGDQDRRMILTTTEGFTAYVEDNPDASELRVESSPGKHDFVFRGGKEVKLEAEDNISVMANKLVDVQAVEDITVKGDKAMTMSAMDNITIEGTGSGSITISQGGGKITLDTGGNITLEGPMVTIKGSAMVTIEGGLIKLN